MPGPRIKQERQRHMLPMYWQRVILIVNRLGPSLPSRLVIGVEHTGDVSIDCWQAELTAVFAQVASSGDDILEQIRLFAA